MKSSKDYMNMDIPMLNNITNQNSDSNNELLMKFEESPNL